MEQQRNSCSRSSRDCIEEWVQRENTKEVLLFKAQKSRKSQIQLRDKQSMQKNPNSFNDP